MLAILIVLAAVVSSLGLLGLFAAARAGQCSRLLEDTPTVADSPSAWELPRAA